MNYWFETMDSYQAYGRTLDPGRGHLVGDQNLEVAAVPRRFRDCSLRHIPRQVPHRDVLYDWARDAVVNINKGRGVVVLGDFAAGKTGAAVSLLIEALHVGAYCFFVKALDLNDIYKSRDGTAIRKRIEKIQFLVIDDVGSARAKDFGVHKEIIEKIIRERYDSMLATVITTNDSLGDLLDHYESIATIIGAAYQVVNCKGVDWRRNEGGEPCLV